MARADDDPAQAEAAMQVLQDEARRADEVRNEAQALVDDLERQIDAAPDEGSDSALADLLDQMGRAEDALAAAEQDFEAVMDQIGEAQQFWYEEDWSD